jgi:CHAD domain-containing protein
MAYRFKLREPFADGIRRIGLQQIDRVIAQLQPPKPAKRGRAVPDPVPGNDATDESAAGLAVHDVRKRLKRMRALLRLARSALSDKTYAHENARYRDTARLLAPARDERVLLETLTRFEGDTTGRTKAAFAAARRVLGGGTVDAAPHENIALALAQMHEARAVMADIAIDGDGYAPMFDGLERVYRQASRAVDDAYESLTDEAFHDARKQIQHHRRHMAILVSAWPEVLTARMAAAAELAQLLGQDHDIAMMRALFADTDADRKSPTALQLKSIETFALERQAELRAKSDPLARRLFAESPAAFADRIRHYWPTRGTP